MAINETLKFSWGHIIAFIALIFISYVSFMGITYLTDGNFLYSGLGVLVIDLVLIAFFILPQILKGTERKFDSKIVFERILIFAAPLFYIGAMIPYSHFWTVFKNREQVETTFSESVNAVKEMFAAYELYAENRIKEYDERLTRTKSKTVQKTNKVEALRLQILDENYDALKTAAIEWIDNASDATVWNVFMLGNIRQIESAIENWNSELNGFSIKSLSDEPDDIKAFSASDPSVAAAKDKLSTLRSVYMTMEAPTLVSILTCLCLYLLLMCPYVIQRRNSKSTYRLIGSERGGSDTKRKKKKSELDDSPISVSKYESFTM